MSKQEDLQCRFASAAASSPLQTLPLPLSMVPFCFLMSASHSLPRKQNKAISFVTDLGTRLWLVSNVLLPKSIGL
jgi:hypothetical protein